MAQENWMGEDGLRRSAVPGLRMASLARVLHRSLVCRGPLATLGSIFITVSARRTWSSLLGQDTAGDFDKNYGI